MNPYYIVVAEWNYPTESGRDVIDDYDTLEEALKHCEDIVDDEQNNFSLVCGDGLDNQRYLNNGEEGYIITTKMGLDDFYFVARVIKVKPIA